MPSLPSGVHTLGRITELCLAGAGQRQGHRAGEATGRNHFCHMNKLISGKPHTNPKVHLIGFPVDPPLPMSFSADASPRSSCAGKTQHEPQPCPALPSRFLGTKDHHEMV